MTARYPRVAVLGAIIAAGGWWHLHTPAPTLLSFRIGQSFEEVAENSSYPVMERSNLPAEDPSGEMFGETWVTEPAVIIRFNDPEHGFTLPVTTFALLGFNRNMAATMSTSPMLEAMPFHRAVVVLENLQNQFKAGGWKPWEGDGSIWFDLTPEGKKRLYRRMFEAGYSQSAELRIPSKYAMTFRLKCAEGCWTGEPPYKFLVDVGIGHDVHDRWDKEDPKDRAHVLPPAPSMQERRAPSAGRGRNSGA